MQTKAPIDIYHKFDEKILGQIGLYLFQRMLCVETTK